MLFPQNDSNNSLRRGLSFGASDKISGLGTENDEDHPKTYMDDTYIPVPHSLAGLPIMILSETPAMQSFFP